MGHLLLTDEEQLLRSTVRGFADDVLAPKASAYDQSGQFPADNVEGLADLGLFGLGIDEAYHGSGGTARQCAIAVEEIARGCTATSAIYVAHQSLAARFIQMYGTEAAQRAGDRKTRNQIPIDQTDPMTARRAGESWRWSVPILAGARMRPSRH